MNNAFYIAGGIIILLIAGAVFFWNVAPSTQQVSCTLEAKLCPDGSSVGRVGPACEFAACPEVEESGNLLSETNEETGITFMYPEALPTFYMEAVDWPPSVAVHDVPYACTQAGTPEERAGGTRESVIDGRTYCITTITEGAAGSVYTQYAYAFAQENRTIIVSFSTRTVQCGNYPEAQKRGCENEQNDFNIDSVVSRIVKSIVLPL